MQRRVDVECGNCYTSYRTEVFGGEAIIPTIRCFCPGCSVELCPCCDQFDCDGCGHKFCESHQIHFQGLSLCIGCLQETLEASEPPCSCQQTDVDLFDATDCDFHNDRSDFTRLMRMATDREKCEETMPEVA